MLKRRINFQYPKTIEDDAFPVKNKPRKKKLKKKFRGVENNFIESSESTSF